MSNSDSYAFIVIAIFIVGIIIFVIWWNLSSSHFGPTLTRGAVNAVVNSKKDIAAREIYNSSFAGRPQGNEDRNWDKKLTNNSYRVVVDYNEFKKKYANTKNIVNGRWKFL